MNKIRLHAYLTNKIHELKLEYSKAEIQRNIEEFGVDINGSRVFRRLTWVNQLDEVSFLHWPQREQSNLDKVRILFENESVIALFKPKNVVVQPGAGHQHDSLLNWLFKHFPQQKDILNSAADDTDNHHITAGLVHRLDKNTQGVLLVARSVEDLRYFQNQFRNRTTQKYYLAVVNGILDSNVVVKLWQSRDDKNPRRQRAFWLESEAAAYSKEARFSHSIFRPKYVCHELNQTLVEVEIKTGRMHQIRLHAEAIGFGLFEEELYTQPNADGFSNAISNPVSVMQNSAEEFSDRVKKIFGESGYCLLSNKITLQQKDGTYLDIRVWDEV